MNENYTMDVWKAIYVASRAELKVNERLQSYGFTSYVPCQKVMKQWSDRKKLITQPMLRGYVFIHNPDQNRLQILETQGVVAFVRNLGADAIITFNASDFPRHILAEEGIARRDPDGFLWEMWSHHPDSVAETVAQIHATAERLSGAPIALKALLKRAQLPKLAKVLQA